MSDKAIRTMTGMVVSCNSDKTAVAKIDRTVKHPKFCLLYTSPSPRDVEESRMPSSA